MILRKYIAIRRDNGAPLAITEVSREHVSVQGWTHHQTFTRRAFHEVFRVKRINREVDHGH
jgi:hypothetical protein